MKTLTTLLILTLLIFTGKTAHSQLSFEVNVSNYQITGDEISFDISLNTTGPDALYLGHADFIFTYNSGNFTTPTFEYIDGSTALVNSNGNTTTAYDFGIVGGFTPEGNLAVNVNAPTPGNQTQFDNAVAKIDNIPGIHKLGTFKLDGITNFAGTLGLQWKMSPPGVSCNVTNFLNVPPFSLSSATGSATFNPPFDSPLPVSISSFTAHADRNNIALAWTTEWEENNERFDIERRLVAPSGSGVEEWTTISSISGAGTTNEATNYSYTDRNLTSAKYEYRLVAIDFNGNVTTDNDYIIGVEIGIPDKFDLSQNFPNPFNPVTKINFEIPVENFITLKVYDLTGREVATLINEQKTPGYYTIDFNASSFASGVYFYRLVTSNTVLTKRMVLVK